MNRRNRTILVILLALGLLAIPTLAAAQSSDDAATDEEVVAEAVAPAAVVTIPVLGSDLVVTISVDDEGTLSGVALDPADGFTLESEQDHKMMFLSEDGSVVVKVKAKSSNISTKVLAKDVASLTGPGTWTGDVFGTGDVATVGYVISVDAAGMPAVTVDEAIDYALADVSIDVKQGELERADADEAASTAKITFERDGDKRSLKITAEVEMQDGESRISLKIMLTGGEKPDVVDESGDSDRTDTKKDKSDEKVKKDKSDDKVKKDKSAGKDKSNTDVAAGDKDQLNDDHRKDD